MTKETLEALRAQADAAIAAGNEQATMAKEMVKLQSIIARNSEVAVQARVRAELKEETTTKLAMLNTACATIVEEMPIYSAKTRSNRTWNPSRQYGMGNHIVALTELLSGIRYAASEHKQQMLAITGLSEDLIEDTMEAFGSTAYYSRNYHTIVDEVPYNYSAVLTNLGLVADRLGVNLELAELNRSKFEKRFTSARLKAEKEYLEAEESINTATVDI